jgi:hypothetical protein
MPLYAVLNPVAAGRCRHPREWRWSSYQAVVAGRGTTRLMGLFGDSPAEAVHGYCRAVDDAVALVLEQRAEDGGKLWTIARAVAAGRQEGSG